MDGSDRVVFDDLYSPYQDRSADATETDLVTWICAELSQNVQPVCWLRASSRVHQTRTKIHLHSRAAITNVLMNAVFTMRGFHFSAS
jgi:hypothetical protein